MYKFDYPTPLGEMTMLSDGNALTMLLFEDKEDKRTIKHAVYKQLPVFEQTIQWLDAYFSHQKPTVLPRLNPINSTPFRQLVWDVLLTIPYGKTLTYGDIARIIADKKQINSMSAQAVGGAIGANPIALLVPCHRVVGKNNTLTGYAGGLDRKEKLLLLEQQ